MSNAICVISTKAPYQGQYAKEAIDAALASASYNITTSLLLMGDGVYQLLLGQTPQQLPRKNLSAILNSLPLYGIDYIYVDKESLIERQLVADQLLSGHILLSPSDLQQLLRQHSFILSF